MRAIRRFVPSSMAGQLILLVAIALFVAQLVNFALLVHARDRQTVTTQTAPAVARIVDALDRRDDADDRRGPGRRGPAMVRFLTHQPTIEGRRREDVERQAQDMLSAAGVTVVSIAAWEREDGQMPRRWRELGRRINRDFPDSRRLLHLSVEYGPGRWITARSWMPREPRRFGGALILQTLILYIIVLLPLLWMARRIGRPLGQLTRSAEQFAQTGAADPVKEDEGPSDVRRLNAAFNAMRGRIGAMLDEKDRMLGAIGHDLRTPLASLRVRTESVEDEGERARMSQTIEEMSRMLDDILTFARLGKQMEPEQAVDLAALADAVVEDFIELGANVAMDEDAVRTVAQARPQLIRRALRNLVENAVKYADGAQVRVVRDAGRVRIEVCDDGPGIDENRIEEMMEPFTRLDSSRNRETGGAGLGLALVRAIMVEHDGELRLANRPEGGLCAGLVLPDRR